MPFYFNSMHKYKYIIFFIQIYLAKRLFYPLLCIQIFYYIRILTVIRRNNTS